MAEPFPYRQAEGLLPGHLYVVLCYPRDPLIEFEERRDLIPASLRRQENKDPELEYGWCFLITSSLQPDGHIYSTLYSLINSGWRRAAYASGLMPGDYILNGHIAKSEPIQKEIMQHKREIGRKIKGVTILLDIGPIDGMLSFETFLTNHDYPRHPEYTSKSIVFWPHEEHMWARRVLVDCPHIHIDEYTILCVEKAARMCARETVAAYPNRRWTGLNNRWRIYELGPVRQYRREGSAYIKKEEDDVVIKHERRSRH